MLKKIVSVIVTILLTYVYFKLIGEPISQYFFRTDYEGMSTILIIAIYFIIVLPCILISIRKIKYIDRK